MRGAGATIAAGMGAGTWDRAASLRALRLVAAIVVIGGLSLWLRAGFPVHAIADAIYDDGLFIRLARNIGAGHWLGRFDATTLVKGPAYPAFIAAAHLLRLRLKLAEQGVYLLACGLVAVVAMQGSGGRAAYRRLGLGCFGLLALNPVLWHPELARVIREGLYVGLSLAVLAVAAIAGFAPAGGSLRRPLAWGALLGAVLGAFWLTREEGVWLLPALAVMAAVAIGHEWRGGARRLPRCSLCAGGAAAAVFWIVLAGVGLANARHYGVFETNEVKSAAFRHAYGALSRIRPAQWQRYAVFPREARLRAYAVSPAARALAPTLDGPDGRNWEQAHCAAFEAGTCTGVHAGWFQWELREAVAAAGFYRSAGAAAAFYRRLAAELDRACDDGRLDCLPPRASLAPPFRWRYVGDALRLAPGMLGRLLRMGDGETGSPPSVGAPAELAAIAALVGPLAPPEGGHLVFQGWAAAAGALPALRIKGEAGSPGALSLLPAADVQAALPGMQAVRFRIDSRCLPAACDLIVDGANGTTLEIPLEQLPRSGSLGSPELTLFIDDQHQAPADPSGLSRHTPCWWIARGIGRCYAAATRILALVAAAGLALALCRRRRCDAPPALYALALGSGVAVASRVILLSYLDVTAIPSANVLYLSPASPLVIVFVVLGLFLGRRCLSGRRD